MSESAFIRMYVVLMQVCVGVSLFTKCYQSHFLNLHLKTTQKIYLQKSTLVLLLAVFYVQRTVAPVLQHFLFISVFFQVQFKVLYFAHKTF